MRPVTAIFAAVMAVLLFCSASAWAQSAEEPAAQVTIDRSKLLVQPKNADESSTPVAFLDDPALWIQQEQRVYYRAMRDAFAAFKTGSPATALLSLMALGFGYGVFHAAGPGHGKVVISSWLLATGAELRRGMLISLLSAVFQALTAILLVSAIFLLAASAGAIVRDVAGILESFSFALIGLLGLYLIWTVLRPLLAAGEMSSPHHHGIGDHAHHDHEHGADCGCGHSHGPSPRDVTGDWSLAKACSIAFAIGIRPCTGALLVLIFANALGLYWAGIASTFAMAAGTFITVSVIAAIAVYAKTWAERVAGRDGRWLSWLATGLRLGGGGVIALLGLVLFLGSLGDNGPSL